MRRGWIAVFILAVAAIYGCGGVSLTGQLNNSGVPGQWAAQIIQPTSTLVVITPSSPVHLLIQAIPVSGFVVGGSLFQNDFTAANPHIPSAICPNIVTIANNGLVTPPPGFPNNSTLEVTLTFAGDGNCNVPINLGAAGTTVLDAAVGPDVITTPTP